MSSDPDAGIGTGAAQGPLRNLSSELQWLRDHPKFAERPATISEFLGPEYLNIEKNVRRRLRKELIAIIGEEVRTDKPTEHRLAMITGGIGIGKTTLASIVLPYLAHWVLCLKDPQGFFNLLPGSRIAFMMMSTSEPQARQVLFADVKARIEHSPWFRDRSYAKVDPNFKNQIRFIEKDIWIIPGDSKETTFEGYNILGGILDEADSHMKTAHKDYAEQGFTTIDSRMASRFGQRGFLLVIGQMKSATGFAAKKYKELKANPDAYAVRLAIWESFGDEHADYQRDASGRVMKFWYDVKRRRITPDAIVAQIGTSPNLLHIPILYKPQFQSHPEKALRDLAGIPPSVENPFIGLVSKIEDARSRWTTSHPGLSAPVDEKGNIAGWVRALDSIRRVAHLDIAVAAGGDALGFAMGHVPRMIDVDGELKPFISIDLLLRVTAPQSGQIILSNIRQIIYSLRDDRKFKLDKITMDGFQSTDTQQQLKKRRFKSEYLSVDRETLPYHDLREAIYEDRIEFPPLIVEIRNDQGLPESVEILVKELSELVDTGKKIDHPQGGSKDVADAVAGVTSTLMGNRQYQRNVIDFGARRDQRTAQAAASRLSHPAYRGDSDVSAPLPPTIGSISGHDWPR